MPPRRKVLKGEGFISDFVDKRLNARPKVVNTYLNSYGKQMIKRIIISRAPVQKAVQLGDFKCTHYGPTVTE